ncbi:MAG: hypothetical protein HOH98_09355 [Flavobacteriaceae bacterium]|jgi:CRISPR/Cas system-associated exonuclease Cas4 (RecB family)|nr:hypothetical protein [Flavobacteriaceae bacterium]
MQNSFEHFKNLVKDDLENLYVDNYRIDAEELKSTKNPNIFYVSGRLNTYKQLFLRCSQKSNFNRFNKYQIWENEHEGEWRTFIKFELFNINSFFEGYDKTMDEIHSYNQEHYPSVREDILKPSKRLFEMIKFLGIKDKFRSNRFAEILSQKTHISHFAYKYIKHINDQPRDIIEELIGEYKLRSKRSQYYKVKKRKQVTASDISEYIFCPASFSIKNTFEVPPSKQMKSGTIMHEKKYLDKFIFNLINKRSNYSFIPDSYYSELQQSEDLDETKFGKLKEKYQKNNRKLFNEISNGMYSNILKSKIVFRGHRDGESKLQSKKNNLQELIKFSKIFSTKDNSVVGVPDYVFEQQDGKKFIVEEKHTWQENVNNAFDNHEMQVLGYMNMIEHNTKKIIPGYLIYFTWGYYKGKISSKKVKLFKVEPTLDKQKKLKNTIDSLESFIKTGKVKFSKRSIDKCIGCTSRVFCDHVNGDIEQVTFPYNS